MAIDVKVTIDLTKVSGSLGFGFPLILEENATKEVAYKECSNLEAVVKAGYGDTTDVYKVAQLMFMQPSKPAKIAVCSASGTGKAWLEVKENMAKGWRQLVVLNGGDTATAVTEIATVIEKASTEKVFFANVDMPTDISKATAVLTAGDVEFNRTVLFYYTATEDIPCPVAALVGEIAGLTVGSYTVNNLILKGLTPLELAQEDIDAIHKIGGITFILSAGDGVCSEGIAASGEYIDIVDGNDYIKQQMEYRTQKVFNSNLKVPYTNAGIAMLESAAVGVMTDAQNKGIIEEFTVNYALRESVSAEDRQARKYFGGNVEYKMQGAIHYIEIYAQATV